MRAKRPGPSARSSRCFAGIRSGREHFETTSGITVERLYTPADAELEYETDVGYPGEFPFTRGIQPTMYRGRFLDHAAVRRLRYGGRNQRTLPSAFLGAGQTGLSVAFDLPTQMGYDSDHPMAAGETGRVGGGDRFTG